MRWPWLPSWHRTGCWVPSQLKNCVDAIRLVSVSSPRDVSPARRLDQRRAMGIHCRPAQTPAAVSANPASQPTRQLASLRRLVTLCTIEASSASWGPAPAPAGLTRAAWALQLSDATHCVGVRGLYAWPIPSMCDNTLVAEACATLSRVTGKAHHQLQTSQLSCLLQHIGAPHAYTLHTL